MGTEVMAFVNINWSGEHIKDDIHEIIQKHIKEGRSVDNIYIKPTFISFEMYGRNIMNYDLLDEITEFLKKYSKDWEISAGEWMACEDGGYFQESEE